MIDHGLLAGRTHDGRALCCGIASCHLVRDGARAGSRHSRAACCDDGAVLGDLAGCNGPACCAGDGGCCSRSQGAA